MASPLTKEFAAAAKEDLRAMAIGIEGEIGSHAGSYGELLEASSNLGRSKVDAALGAGVRGFMKVTLMNRWNQTMKNLAGVMTMDKILRLAANPSAMSKDEVTYFAKMGVSPEMYGRFAEQFSNHGQDLKGLKIPNVNSWVDVEAADKLKQVVFKATEMIINTPHAGTVPIVMKSHPLIKTLAQFQTFMYAAHEQMTLPMLQNNNINGYLGMAGMIGLGAIANNARSLINDQAPPKDAISLVMQAGDRVGYMGIIGEAAGRTGLTGEVKKLLGIDPTDRREQWSGYEKVAGPGFGMIAKNVANLIEGYNTSMDDSQTFDATKFTRTIADRTPYHNLWGINWPKAIQRTLEGQQSISDVFDNYMEKAPDQFTLDRIGSK
jgi:hypothetical protein